jgi:hypothetical protein
MLGVRETHQRAPAEIAKMAISVGREHVPGEIMRTTWLLVVGHIQSLVLTKYPDANLTAILAWATDRRMEVCSMLQWGDN